ncbi:ArsR/SmtB family transcription factor [Streptomyces hirsutus]|uniref:ArsR/SmtB family transcription factor n=1 Tax=Streptomyces hirsutus TaxID=35620 RepID=UPI00099E7035|nr:metalloregulator ArsR/SmtB family transcription factor [Streptomyces hirsutus]
MAISSYGVRAETVPDGSEASAAGLARLLIDRGEAERLAAVLKAIADPTRLQLLRLIERAPRGEACVCDLTDCLGLRQPTVSHHLKVMTESGLLNRERRGTWVWYSVDPAGLRRVREVLEPVSPQEPVAV